MTTVSMSCDADYISCLFLRLRFVTNGVFKAHSFGFVGFRGSWNPRVEKK